MNASTSLHESVAEVGVLVENEVSSSEGELVLVVSSGELGVVGEGGLENDLGRSSSEVHDGESVG